VAQADFEIGAYSGYVSRPGYRFSCRFKIHSLVFLVRQSAGAFFAIFAQQICCATK
jgi:hypothetical protein